ncbi:hypothetical protein BJP40_19160 [Streptomyces sp. CC53]|uniref:hypothetical protein n=1 Tax=Streptomyces sp. CC53 TaxID=1906740 RepID=UPI0008DDD46E|nr:hypothetical protein [Streptomyces sp. CC53]OII64814.1 hypothetical protein BJP40_19160 [Streptomyces sp. CC53]
MTFKMTWALIAEHADEWIGDDFLRVAAVLNERVGAAVTASGMTTDAQEHFRETFLDPIQDGLTTAGKSAVESGLEWSKATGPLLVTLTPTA